MKKLIVFLGMALCLCLNGSALALDIDTDSNDAVDIVYGGTNATSAGAALTNLGAESETHASEHAVGGDDPVIMDLDEIGNPNTFKTFTMANYYLKFDWTTANPFAAITLFELESEADPTDTDVVFFWIEAGGDGGTDLMKITGTATRATMTGDLTINTSQTNYSSIDNYKVNNVSLNDLDMGFTVGQTGTTLTMTGAIVGELSEIDEGAISGDTLTAAQCRGTLITNEGDADGETWAFQGNMR